MEPNNDLLNESSQPSIKSSDSTSIPEAPVPIKGKKNNKKFILIGIALCLFIGTISLLVKVSFFEKDSADFDKEIGFNDNEYVNSENEDWSQDQSQNEIENTSDYTTYEYKEPEFLREKKLTLEEYQELEPKLAPLFGVIEVNNAIFTHSINHNGIEIKWTDKQPLNSEKIDWIKRILDSAPEYLSKNYPINQILSANYQEMGFSEMEETLSTNTAAYASGTNIFIADKLLQDVASAVSDPITEAEFRRTLYHEWMHVAQYQELIQTLTEEYLREYSASGIRHLFNISPYVENFGFSAGWYYKENFTTPDLKEDEESQKSSWYGKFMMYEDMAETASGVFTCDAYEYSQARINYITKLAGKQAKDFCF